MATPGSSRRSMRRASCRPMVVVSPFSAEAMERAWAEGVGSPAADRLSDARVTAIGFLAVVKATAVQQYGKSQGRRHRMVRPEQVTPGLENRAARANGLDAVESHARDEISAIRSSAPRSRDVWEGHSHSRPLWLVSPEVEHRHTKQVGVGASSRLCSRWITFCCRRTLHPTRHSSFAGRLPALVDEPFP